MIQAIYMVIYLHCHMSRVRLMDLAAAKEEEERQEGRVKTNVFAYVMSCLVLIFHLHFLVLII